MLVVGYETEHDRDDTMAGQMVDDLAKAYPGHGWFVKITGGVVAIRPTAFPQNWYMSLKYADVKGDANERRRDVVRAAGEFLERANLKRGANTGEQAKAIDGIADKYMTRTGL